MADVEHLFGEEPRRERPASHAASAMKLARAKLKPPTPAEPMWRLVGAAGLAAASALCLAVVVILGPPGPAPPNGQTDVNPWVR